MKTKKIILALVALAVAFGASAIDPKELIGGLIGKAVESKSFGVDDIVGVWKYTSPAVSFESDNVLKNLGGAGASSVVEGKLTPYYQRLKLNKTELTVDESHNFVLKLGLVTLKGTVEKGEGDEGLVFNFNALGGKSLGSMKAHATKAGQTLNLTFDATKLVNILTQISSKVNVKTLSTLTTMLNSYDGIYMGFKLKSEKQ